MKRIKTKSESKVTIEITWHLFICFLYRTPEINAVALARMKNKTPTVCKQQMKETSWVETSNTDIRCSQLPKHHRSNKSLPEQFRVCHMGNVRNGTKVTVSFANRKGLAKVHNALAYMKDSEAHFKDLRIKGRCGKAGSGKSIFYWFIYVFQS